MFILSDEDEEGLLLTSNDKRINKLKSVKSDNEDYDTLNS